LEDVNVGSATVTVRRNRVELLENDRAAFDADPKTDAGKRTVAIPRMSSRCSRSIWRAGPDRIGCSMRYDRARKNLDRHPNYILAAYMASGT
jgi:hypothetical protein